MITKEQADELLSWQKTRADEDIRRSGYALDEYINHLQACMRRAIECCQGSVNADTLAVWKKAAENNKDQARCQASPECSCSTGGQNGND